jgi:hypothetical protein
VSAGAVPVDCKATGFFADWQDEPAIAATASTTIRTWSFATRIIFYEIRICSLVLWFGEFYQKIVRRALHQVNAEKTHPPVTFDTPRMVTSVKFRRRKHCQRFEERCIEQASANANRAISDAPVIGTPNLDRFLDVCGG